MDWLHEHNLVDLLVIVRRPFYFPAQLILATTPQPLARHACAGNPAGISCGHLIARAVQ